MATLPQALGTSIPKMGVRMPPAPPAPTPTPAPAGGEFDVLAQQTQQKLEPLQQRISGLESQQMQLGAERSQFEAAQKAKQATGEAGIQQAFQQRTEQAPLRGELEQKVQQEKDFFFQPSREDGMAMASLASLIMVIGTSLGKGGKGNAMAALSGLNGMMEGYQKGRDDIFKQEKSQFETNAKALTTQIGNIRKALEDYEKMAVRDRETATLQLRESLAKEGADFLAARAEREGAVRLLPELRKTERQLQQEVSKYESKAADARSKAEAARIAQEAKIESERRHRETMMALQAQKQAGQQAMLDQRLAMADSKAKDATKQDKPPPKEVVSLNSARNVLIPALDEGIKVLDRINKEGKWELMTTTFGVNPRLAELAFRDDKEALELIRTFSKFRSGEFETAGKALTKTENKILAPLYQADFRVYEGIRNAMEQGLKTLKLEQKGMESAYPYIKKYNQTIRGDLGTAEPESAPVRSFNSVQEAEAANLPKGTRIIINGRSATVE